MSPLLGLIPLYRKAGFTYAGNSCRVGSVITERVVTRERVLAMGLLGVVFALGTAAFMASPADAYKCEPPGRHCYARAAFSTGGGQMASEAVSFIYLGCVGVGGQTEGNFNSDEMWAIKGGGSWIEAGIITGDGANQENKEEGYDYTEPHFFVSYDRTNHEHENAGVNEVVSTTEAPTHTLNEIRLWQSSPEESTTWNGWTAGTGKVPVEGFANRYAATELQVGLETTEEEGWNDAAFADLAYLNWNGDEYTTEWSHGSYHAERELEGPESAGLYFDWEHKYYEADFGHNNHGC